MSVTNWLKLPLLAANYDGMMSLRKKMVVQVNWETEDSQLLQWKIRSVTGSSLKGGTAFGEDYGLKFCWGTCSERIQEPESCDGVGSNQMISGTQKWQLSLFVVLFVSMLWLLIVPLSNAALKSCSVSTLHQLENVEPKKSIASKKTCFLFWAN